MRTSVKVQALLVAQVFSLMAAVSVARAQPGDPTAGARLVKDINPVRNPGANSSPAQFVESGGVVFFTANDGANGNELWRTDGTAAGTALVKDIWLGLGSSDPGNLVDVNGTLFFAAVEPGGQNDPSGRELWKSDGTPAGTVRVKDINPGPAWSSPSNLTNVSRHALLHGHSTHHGHRALEE